MDPALDDGSVGSIENAELPARLEAESAPGHDLSEVEASPGALRKSPGSSESGVHSHDAVDTSVVEPELFKIVRASARIRIDFQRLGKDEAAELRKVLRDSRQLCANVANAVVRELQRQDETALDAFLREHGRMPAKAIELPRAKLKTNGYQLGRQVAPSLSAGIVSAVARMAHDKWTQERWETLVWQRRKPLRYTLTLPVPVRAQEWAGTSDDHPARYLEKEADGWWLSVAFEEGRGKRMRLPLDIRDSHHRKIVTALKSGEWKGGELRIQEDSKRPGKWYLRFAYKRLQLKRTRGVSAAINRGIRNMLVIVLETGEQRLYSGDDIVAYLKQIERRRKEYQRSAFASRRGGRGRKRILRPIEPLLRRAANYRAWRNQNVARQVATWLRSQGVARLYIEDLSGVRRGEPERLEGGERVWKTLQTWPYFDLGTRLEACCRELGIDTSVQPAWYLSQLCPACGKCGEELRDLKNWRLRCDCGFNRDLDVAAAQNNLARGEAVRTGDQAYIDRLESLTTGKKRTARKTARKPPKRQARKKGGAQKPQRE